MPTPKTPPTLDCFPQRVQEIILHEVMHAAPFGVKVDEVLGFSRHKPLVRLRWRIWWRQRNELTGVAHSWVWMGNAWRRDRTTIMNGVATYESEMPDAPCAASGDWVERKRMAYRTSREKHAARYRHIYPHLGLPHERTPT